MTGALLAWLLLWAPEPASLEVLAPGSVEDCMVWSLVDLGKAPEAERDRWAARAGMLMVEQFDGVLERGGSPDDALRRQKELLGFVKARTNRTGSADQAACLKSHPLPTAEEAADEP